jgi:hypothetical protein
VSELFGGSIDAPELVPGRSSGDEDAIFVPALDPSNAVIQLKESGCYGLATLVLDGRSDFPLLVVVLEEVATQDARAMNGNWLG